MRLNYRPELVISVISLLLAAFSVVFTYDQIRIMRAERLTPYRAILFNEKLNSYRTVRIASAEVQRHHDGFLMYGVMRAPSEDRTPQESSIHDSLASYISILGTQNVLWPDEIVQLTTRASTSAADVQHCLNDLDMQLRGERRGMGRLFGRACPREQYERTYVAFSKARQDVDSAMRDSLRADQLQSIAAD